jgi:two-component system NtrC family sensor kinase
LLDFARPEGRESFGGAGGESGRFEAPAQVRAVLDDALQLARVQRGWKDIDVVVRIPDELVVPIRADRLKQVFLNLLMNAGAALEAAKRPTLSVHGMLRDRDTVVVFEDNGAGVPEELQDRIFEPFVTTKDVGEGTGLGLAVCRGLVEDAGGKLVFEPGPNGVGARFSIRFSSRGAPTPSRS